MSLASVMSASGSSPRSNDSRKLFISTCKKWRILWRTKRVSYWYTFLTEKTLWTYSIYYRYTIHGSIQNATKRFVKLTKTRCVKTKNLWLTSISKNWNFLIYSVFLRNYVHSYVYKTKTLLEVIFFLLKYRIQLYSMIHIRILLRYSRESWVH